MESEEEVERRLEALLIRDQEFQTLEASSNHFCPFEAMGMVNAEIRHASFLTTMLDPFRPHGYGSRLLRGILMEAVSAARDSGVSADGYSKLDIHLLNLDDAEIRREWRNIDLIAIVPSSQAVFTFELKIESTQGNGQLERYRKIVEEVWPGWRKVFIFLTKHPEAPSDQAWIPLRLSRVAKVLEDLGDSPAANPSARDTLAAYVAMIRKHHMDNERMAKLAASLWSRHKEALEFLMERRPDPLSDIFRGMTEELDAICLANGKRGSKIAPDKCTGSYLRFAVTDWDRLPGFTSGEGWTPSGRLFLIEITWDETELFAGIVMGPGPESIRNRYIDALQSSGVHDFPKRPGRHKWLESATLYELKDDEEERGFDYATALVTAKGNFAEFVESVISKYSKAFALIK